jgi:hypothetical protein
MYSEFTAEIAGDLVRLLTASNHINTPLCAAGPLGGKQCHGTDGASAPARVGRFGLERQPQELERRIVRGK